MRRVIDIRSDTVTRPTEEMRLAMYRADVGDDGRIGPSGKGEDPTVNELEALAARTLGKEDALLVASGTMGNLVAMMAHCSRGQEAIVGQTAHIYRTEKAAFEEEVFGLKPLEVPDRQGFPDLGSVNYHLSTGKPQVLCLENTHNFAGGTVMAPDVIGALADAAHARGVLVHLDGARLFNAAVALGIEARRLVESVDSVMFCLSKGLSAPVGSLVVGTADFVSKARQRRKLIGGQMRQAGILAAAGIVAVQSMVARLQEDHDKARRLAERLAGIDGLAIDFSTVQTNIVKVDVSGTGLTAREFQREISARGVLVHLMSMTEIRLVTHKDVDLQQVLQAAEIIGDFVSNRAHARRGG